MNYLANGKCKIKNTFKKFNKNLKGLIALQTIIVNFYNFF